MVLQRKAQFLHWMQLPAFRMSLCSIKTDSKSFSFEARTKWNCRNSVLNFWNSRSFAHYNTSCRTMKRLTLRGEGYQLDTSYKWQRRLIFNVVHTLYVIAVGNVSMTVGFVSWLIWIWCPLSRVAEVRMPFFVWNCAKILARRNLLNGSDLSVLVSALWTLFRYNKIEIPTDIVLY